MDGEIIDFIDAYLHYNMKEKEVLQKNGADPKVLKFKKVYMITHRRSGLLISKFAL